MLSGRSTVVAAWPFCIVESVLAECRRKLNLAVDGSTMELWHCSGEKVPTDLTVVRDWPGVQPEGEISEYQLVMRRWCGVLSQSYEKDSNILLAMSYEAHSTQQQSVERAKSSKTAGEVVRFS
eukprot:3876530-Amphidinium_carterae.1